MYKFLSVLVLVLSAYHTNAQTYCFQSEDDVMTYVIGKTFESKDGQVSIKFNSSEAILKAGENNLTYMYEQFNYMGGGHKGLVTLTELGGSGGLQLYVSCKEKMMTDNKGTLLYEKGNIGNSSSINSSLKIVKVGGLEVIDNDLGSFSWQNAKDKADSYNSWRLPNLEEMTLIMQNADMFSILGTYEWWWTSEVYSDNEIQVVSFKYATYLPSEINQKHGLLLVRNK
jgi:hypothetical protein